MKDNALPPSYTPPKKMSIGTNTLENVNVLLSFNGYVPILIGDGEKPHVWINIPMNKEGTEWYPLIKNNFSTNPKVLVITSKKSVKVTTPDGVVLECSKLEDGSIIVSHLNLRPFGLNVISDTNQLKIMNQTFTTSGFKNVGIMFAVGSA